MLPSIHPCTPVWKQARTHTHKYAKQELNLVNKQACTLSHTVFDLISGLFVYIILGQKNALFSEPHALFFFFKYCNRALCNLLYLLCTLSASIPGAKGYFRRSLHVREGRKEGNLYFGK